jgi:hypothetical protein
MKSGTGDVWGDDDEDEETETVAESDDSTPVDDADAVGSDRSDDGGLPDAEARRETGERTGTAGDAPAAATDENDIADNDISSDRGSDDSDSDGGGGEQPYVVRRMLKDKSVQFERDERLTLFVHDDVKTGEQELEAETQELFGRDIPVFDIREAVYRAALRNRDDVVDELEQMGYTRE